MFEDSLIESADRIKSRSKYWSLATFALNVAVLLVVIIWPLLHPAALPTQVMAPLMVAPPPPPAPPHAAPAPKVQATSEMLVNQPSRIPRITKLVSAIPPSTEGVIKGIESGAPGGVGNVFDGIGPGPAVNVKQHASSQPLSISSGVMAGYLLTTTMPQYPPIPRAANIQGTVVLQATISKMGLIQNIQVISGPPMLRQAAIDAVRTWRYRPYLLNGEPIEVETTINVVFNLGR